jgi:hypothetical protein
MTCQLRKAFERISEFAAQIVATPVPPADCEPGSREVLQEHRQAAWTLRRKRTHKRFSGVHITPAHGSTASIRAGRFPRSHHDRAHHQ